MTTVADRPPLAQAALVLIGTSSVILALFSTAPMIVAFSGVCLIVMIMLLWRGDEPPILLLPVLFQWSEVAIVPISTVWKGVSLNELSTYGADLESSATYGLLGVLLMAVGLRLGAGTMRRAPLTKRLIEESNVLEIDQVLRMSLAAIAIGYAAAIVRPYSGGAAEMVHQISGLKECGLFILTFWCLSRKKYVGILLTVVLFDIVSGLTGFFAEFKDSVLTFLVAAMAARPRVRLADVLVVSAAGGLLLFIAIFWSEVKPGYREFMNQGTGQQVISVPVSERLGYLANAAATMDGERFADGADRLVLRHGYIEFLGLTMQYVPQTLRHEDGKLTLAVVQHITMPRVLFPEKPPLPNDTDVMVTYTGLPNLWTGETSISLGYLAELYVDFGYFGGLVGCLAIGWIFGRVCGALRSCRRSPALITGGLMMMAVLPLAYFGTAYVKLVAGGVFCAIIAFGTQRMVLPAILPALLKVRRKEREVIVLE